MDKCNHFPLSGAKSGPSLSTEVVSQLGSTSAEGVLMASEDFTGHLTGDAAFSEEKTDAVELCKLDATEPGVDEPNPQNSLMEGHQMELEEVETHQEEMEEDQDLGQQQDVDQGNSPEKGSPSDQGEEEENSVQEDCEQKDAGKLEKSKDESNTEETAQKNKDKSSTEDMAHSSEELVIAKVEDFTNEMAIDVDQTEVRDGKMEVDDAGLC